MSKVVGFVVGAAQIIAGVILLGVPGGQALGISLIIGGSTMIVSNAVLLLTMPKAPARQASEMFIQLGEQPRSALFGEEVFTPGSLVDGFNYGGKYGTDWEVLIIRLADHKCGDLIGIYVDGEFQAFAGDGAQPGRDNAFWCWYRSDTSTQALPSVVTTNGPGWSASDIGESGCDVIVAYKADTPDEGNPDWPGGRPRFGFLLQGKYCYDPRLDSTVTGGSGTQRWHDPSTWTITSNAAICRYNWVRGIYANDQVNDPSQLLIGRGLSAAEAPPENVFAAANLCDELVDGAPRYRTAGPVYASQPHLEVEEMFAAATGGSIVTREGSVELEPGGAKSVVATFTDDDLLSGSRASWNQGILSESSGEWINTVVARYVEPTQKWNDHAAPVVRDPATIISDGKPRETSITLRLVTWVNQALRVAEITRRLGRKWGRASATLGPRFCELEDGDWVQWQSDRRFGGDTRTFRVEAYSIDAKWHNSLTLREMSADIYGTAVFEEDYSEVNQPTPPATPDPPDPVTWTLTAEMLTSAGASIPAIVFAGAVDDPDTSVVVFEYWKDDGIIDPVANPDDPAWISAGTFGPTVTRVEVTSIVGGASYYGSVTYIQDGFTSDRLILGPVTAGELSVNTSASLTASETIAALSFVNIHASSGAKVRLANATDDTKPVNGFAPSAIANAATGNVRGTGGKITGLSGLTPGATYYLSTTGGAITATAPSSAGNLVQEVGVAVSATELLFHPKLGTTV